MLARQTVVVPDIATDSRIPQDLYASTFVKALVIAPVGASDPVGAIGAYWADPYTPTTAEVDMLEALADAAASALEGVSFSAGKLPSSAGRASNDDDIARVGRIAAVPMILDVVLRLTGMGFAAVARVTDDRWMACQVLDHVSFGLAPGGELPLKSTLCDEIKGHRNPIVFDDAQQDETYCEHHTPRTYGLRSYISVPIILANGEMFGTLCAIDANPAKVNNPQVLGTFQLFAELIAQHLDADERLNASEASLKRELELADLREQFIAVLGHDLRNPIAALSAGTSRLMKDGWTDTTPRILSLMKASVARMSGLVDNVMDLARARLGGGIALDLVEGDVGLTLSQVIDELRVAHPDRTIEARLALPHHVPVDHGRIAQMTSNLLSNAITHGAGDLPVLISADIESGRLIVRVVNGGTPITSDQMDKLFQPFRRGDLHSSAEGLGLGLYIASQIAKAHGGDIVVKSDESETSFSFVMPFHSVVSEELAEMR